MKIRYTGKARARIEGFGYIDPGAEITAPEALGRELVRGKEFREITEPTGGDTAPANDVKPRARRSRRKKV